MSYNFKEIEPKWQKMWEEENIYKTTADRVRKKYYVLEMFPYPSGKLHMGHVRNYTIGDVVARFKSMEGYNVLHPMGWDAFGLPAENAAFKHGTHPAKWTWSNIENMRNQLKELGISYDWDREVASCHPDYYKWTQWFFIKMFEKGLAYKKKSAVNWCPSCATVLANEQVVDGECERCSSVVRKKDLEQWFFKITEYADRLLKDTKLLEGWPEKVKIMQHNWIGRSEGAQAVFKVKETGEEIPIYTTRQDTLFGVTYMVLAPEHPLVDKLVAGTSFEKPVKEFKDKMETLNEIARTATNVEKEGLFTGKYAINPLSGEEVPIWIANYVLMDYGTGAVMGVPAHDERDFLFAKKYNLPIKIVIQRPDKELTLDEMETAYTEPGIMVNSGVYDGMNSIKALGDIANNLEEKGLGKKKVNYRLRDWLISRQRYWGTPIPIIYCDTCGVLPVPIEELPVILPEDAKLEAHGESPLAKSQSFSKGKCPRCGKECKRETDTMDTFVDSSWYFLRFCSPKCETAPFLKEDADYWMDIDQYIGGVEHAILHLMYARFFTKVLYDMDLVSVKEPFRNLLTQGMVLKDGAKMSKSKGNVVSPEDIVKTYGADTARLFILFASPPERDLEWSDAGVEGAYRFLNRVWRLVMESEDNKVEADSGTQKELRRITHVTIKRVTEDVRDRFNFNTAISAIMEMVNFMNAYKEKYSISSEEFINARETLMILLAPFAPHISEEMWSSKGYEGSIHLVEWPKYDQDALAVDEIEVVLQINGKVKDRIMVPSGVTKEELEILASDSQKVKNHTIGKEIVKIVSVPGKLVNIVVK